MPASALPPHLRDIENHFPDDDQYNHIPVFGKLYRWYQKKTKTWFAFSYRCDELWARWRKVPKTLIAWGGDEKWRAESVADEWYYSRIQYYNRWSLIVQWPLMISAHWYPKAADVPNFWEPLPNTDGKLWFFFWNHYDADNVYWMLTSVFIGRVWK